VSDQLVASIIVIAIMLLIGFPVHEFSHALAAYRLGDSTARFMGRLSLNPIVHFDPLGGILLGITFIASQGTFGFGWAKPTPVNPRNLEGGRYGEALVAAAGAIPLRYIRATPSLSEQIPFIVVYVLLIFVNINVVLMVFNLFPIPPLDGSKVLFAFLPPQVSWRWRPVLEQYGFVLLMIAFFIPPGDSIGGRILLPIIDAIRGFLVGL
jgi:Zn-dependent protease